MSTTYSATVADGSATLTLHTLHSPQSLTVPDAAGLAMKIAAVMEDALSNGARMSDAHTVHPTKDGIRIKARSGNFDLPWRWVVPILRDLAQ